MSELEKIRISLARDGRKAYQMAKKNGNAYVLSGNKICRVGVDGQHEVISVLPQTKVLVKSKKFAL